ncbi:MAG TPA: hypothetical protein PKC58_17335 [Ignavibacteria bacterium]|nr:hypothetical protein [Ignavibacteria bacterium]
MSSDRITKENSDNYALFVLLRTFTPDEWKEFEKFIASPYFNKGRNYLPFVKILKKYHPGYDKEKLSKENIYKKLFPGKVYKESVISSMFSRLYNLGEEFLIHFEFNKENNIKKEIIAIGALNSRKLKSKALKRATKAENMINGSAVGKDHYLIKKLYYTELGYFHYYNENRHQLYDIFNLILDNIFYSFLIEFSHTDSSMLAHKISWKSDHENSLITKMTDHIDFDKIFELIRKEDKIEYPFIRISYLMYKAIKNLENDDHYFELKELTYANFNKLDYSYRKQILNTLALICNLKFINGKNDFKVEAFEIKKNAIENDLFEKTGNHIKIDEFRSVFLEALNVNQIKWAEEFAEKYNVKLSPQVRKDVLNYCKARIAFENSEFDKAIEHIMEVNINHIAFKIDMKNLLAKIYYETNSTESLHSLLNTYYQLLNNSGFQIEELALRHFNFIKYLKNILKIKENFKSNSEFEILKKAFYLKM